MRELKFRAWDGSKMYVPDFIDQDGFATTWPPENSRISNFDTWETHKVMQYTGLHDKSGKEIYEGDIVDLGTGAVVEWDGPTGAWTAGDWLLSKKIIEVIGNIYENPELLGQPKASD